MSNLLATSPARPPIFVIIVLCLAAVVVLLACATLLYVCISDKKRANKNKSNACAEKQNEAKAKANVPPSPTEEIFLKHKKKFLIEAIVKSAIFGVSLGLIVVGILLLSLKLSAITINAGYYVLIGVGVALICGVLLFLVLRPTDKRAARKLDDENHLNERVQTSLAFKEKDGVIIGMQREDAGEKMRNLPRRKLSFSKVWQYCVIAVLALSLSFTAFFIPGKQLASGEPNGPGFELDPDTAPWTFNPITEQRVRDLIEEVKSSELRDGIKEAAVAELEDLIVVLHGVKTIGEKNNSVNYTIYKIDSIIKAAISYEQVIEATQSTIPEIALSIKDGIETYDTYTLTDYENVKFFSSRKFDLITDAIATYMANLSEKITAENRDELKQMAAAEAELVQNVIDASGVATRANDAYFDALANFRDGFIDIRDTNAVFNTLKSKLKTVYDNLTNNLADAIGVEAYELAMNDYIAFKLLIIFGMEVMLPGGSTGSGGGGNPGDKPGDWDGPGNDPGIFGDSKYGSDDEIFDPLVGDFVPYGTVIQRYYAIFNEYLASGKLTAEQEHAARVYFELLFKGFDD